MSVLSVFSSSHLVDGLLCIDLTVQSCSPTNLAQDLDGHSGKYDSIEIVLPNPANPDHCQFPLSGLLTAIKTAVPLQDGMEVRFNCLQLKQGGGVVGFNNIVTFLEGPDGGPGMRGGTLALVDAPLVFCPDSVSRFLRLSTDGLLRTINLDGVVSRVDGHNLDFFLRAASHSHVVLITDCDNLLPHLPAMAHDSTLVSTITIVGSYDDVRAATLSFVNAMKHLTNPVDFTATDVNFGGGDQGCSVITRRTGI